MINLSPADHLRSLRAKPAPAISTQAAFEVRCMEFDAAIAQLLALRAAHFGAAPKAATAANLDAATYAVEQIEDLAAYIISTKA